MRYTTLRSHIKLEIHEQVMNNLFVIQLNNLSVQTNRLFITCSCISSFLDGQVIELKERVTALEAAAILRTEVCV